MNRNTIACLLIGGPSDGERHALIASGGKPPETVNMVGHIEPCIFARPRNPSAAADFTTFAYRRESLVCGEAIYWVYDEDRHGGKDIVQQLIEGYRPRNQK